MPLKKIFPYSYITEFDPLLGLVTGDYFPGGRYMKISGRVEVRGKEVNIIDEKGVVGTIPSNLAVPFLQYDGRQVKFGGYIDLHRRISPKKQWLNKVW